jgi:hypothetical protein
MRLKTVVLASFLLLVGILLVLIAIHFGSPVPSTTNAATPPVAVPTIGSTFFLLLQTIGISLIGFAIFSVLVDMKNWRDYFSSRLREIVVDQAYLKNLDPSKLLELQENAWCALYHNPALGNEGTFLSFCRDALHRFINDPYREDVIVEVFVTNKESGILNVRDIVTYTCRQAGDSIQEFVAFDYDSDEVLKVNAIKVSVELPADGQVRGKIVTILEKDLSQTAIHECSQKCRLEDPYRLDKLKVKVESDYEISPDAFQYWAMAHPTRDFDLTITYPDNFTIQLKPFVLRPEVLNVSTQDGYCRIRYSSWMLPESGIVWRLYSKPIANIADREQSSSANAHPKVIARQ